MTKYIEGKAASPWGDAISVPVNGARAAPAKSTSARSKRGIVIATSVAIAAVIGAMAGAFSGNGLMQPKAEAPQAAPVATIYETRALQGAITQLRTDLSALKTTT